MWTPRGRPIRAPSRIERVAVALLAGVGSNREWWAWNSAVAIGHLRVGLAEAEVALLAEYPAVHDAGDVGPERRRTPPKNRSSPVSYGRVSPVPDNPRKSI
jgi:hypothetical protein